MYLGKTDVKNWRQIIIDGARSLGLNVGEDQARLFEKHASHLLTWNRKKNLTSITDPFQVAVKHFLDSIAAAPMVPEGSRLMDIGSGGGFPGIPLKIMIPSIQALLVDASRKKISFLRHVVRDLKLDGVSAEQIRAEDLTDRSEFQGGFDIVACRALTDLRSFLEIASPFVSEKGILLAYKANFSDDEIRQAQVFANQTAPSIHRWEAGVASYQLPFLNQPRTIVTFRRRKADDGVKQHVHQRAGQR